MTAREERETYEDRRARPDDASAGDAGSRGAGGGGSSRDDAELRRMAMFRIREAANRLATLANSAQDERLRDELLRVYRALLEHERALRDGGPPPHKS